MLLDRNLQKFGLNEKEAKVYLATLQLGSGTILEIAKKAELKRPTVYLILDDLRNKGLITEIPKEKKRLFLAENPEKIKDLIKQKEKAFNDILPLLSAISNVNKEKPQVTFYEGVEAIINNIYKETWNINEEVLFYAQIKDMLENFPEVLQNFEKSIKAGKVKKARELISDIPEDIEYAHKFKDNYPAHQVRVVPKGYQFFNTDNIIYRNKLAIISLKKNIFAVVIESKDIADTYHKLFNLAWQVCQPVDWEKYKK